MKTYTTSKAAELAERLAAQKAENDRRLAEIQAEQEAHDKKLAAALAKAGPARVALVEDLLEKFEIPAAELETQRNKRTGEIITDRKTGEPKLVDPDADETVRMQRLAAAIDKLVELAAATSAQSEHALESVLRDDDGVDDEHGEDTFSQAS